MELEQKKRDLAILNKKWEKIPSHTDNIYENLQTNKQEIISFALKLVKEIEIRKLLAPELKFYTYMNALICFSKSKEPKKFEKLKQWIFDFYGVDESFKEDSFAYYSLELFDNSNEVDLIYSYFECYEKMRPTIKVIAKEIGRSENISLEELELFFLNETIRKANEKSYEIYKKQKSEFFMPIEEKVNKIFENEDYFIKFFNCLRKSNRDHFPIFFPKKPKSSIFDLIAKMKKFQIVIHSLDLNCNVLYKTAEWNSGNVVHILFEGIDKFSLLAESNEDKDSSSENEG